jgi:hypothetical protein
MLLGMTVSRAVTYCGHCIQRLTMIKKKDAHGERIKVERGLMNNGH